MRHDVRRLRCCVIAVAAALSPAACGPSAMGGPDASTSPDGGAPIDGSGVQVGDGGCVRGTGASQTVVIGPDGGTLAFEAVTLAVPAGALADDTPITVTSTMECPVDVFDALTPLYRFEPPGLAFAQPAQVTLAYPGNGPALLRWTAPAIGWETPGIAAGGGSVAGAITHFSNGYAGWSSYLTGAELTFTAVPSEIDPGEQATLTVVVKGVHSESCSIDPGIVFSDAPYRYGPGGYQSALVVTPAMTTTYTATCTGDVNVSATETVTVRDQPAFTLTALPSTIDAGQSATLTWTIGMPSECTVSGPGLELSTMTSGSTSVMQLQSATYSLACGKSLRRANVQVNCKKLGETCGSPEQCCWPGAASDCLGKCCMKHLRLCAATSDCCQASDVCVGRFCCGFRYSSCASDDDCCSPYHCNAKLCCNNPGQDCAIDGDCCAGDKCQQAKCCASDHNPCVNPTDCCNSTSMCVNHFCEPLCGTPGTTCATNLDCCGGSVCKHAPLGTSMSCCIPAPPLTTAKCTANGDCCANAAGMAIACTSGACCNYVGGGCTNDVDCCTGEVCMNNTCQWLCPPRRAGLQCMSATDCCPGEACGATPSTLGTQVARCCEPPGTTQVFGVDACNTDEDCCADGNIIVHCTPGGGACCNQPLDSCAADADCCGGAKCVAGQCTMLCGTIGGTCTTNSDCCAGTACPSGQCCSSGPCTTNTDCCLFTDPMFYGCQRGICGPPSSANGQPCGAGCLGGGCVGNVCCASASAFCIDNTDCCSGAGLKCTSLPGTKVGYPNSCCVPPGGACTSRDDCCYQPRNTTGGTLINCTNNKCCNPPGATCGPLGKQGCCSSSCNTHGTCD